MASSQVAPAEMVTTALDLAYPDLRQALAASPTSTLRIPTIVLVVAIEKEDYSYRFAGPQGRSASFAAHSECHKDRQEPCSVDFEMAGEEKICVHLICKYAEKNFVSWTLLFTLARERRRRKHTCRGVGIMGNGNSSVSRSQD